MRLWLLLNTDNEQVVLHLWTTLWLW